MRIWIDRDVCKGELSECMACLIHFVRARVARRPCIVDYESGSSKDIKIFTNSEGQDREPLVIPKVLVDMVAYEFKEGVLAPKIDLDF